MTNQIKINKLKSALKVAIETNNHRLSASIQDSLDSLLNVTPVPQPIYVFDTEVKLKSQNNKVSNRPRRRIAKHAYQM